MPVRPSHAEERVDKAMITPTSELLHRKYVAPETTSAAAHRQVNSVPERNVRLPMIAWNRRPGSDQASTYCATLKATLIACFVPATSPMIEAITCAAIAGKGPKLKKMANEKVADATTS